MRSGKNIGMVRSVLPVVTWLPTYRFEWLRLDLVAGTTLAAYAVPNSLAYALLAGLPPQAGLYSCLLGGLAYALFGSSRQLAIGPTSAISLVVASTLGALALHDPGRHAAFAALTALLVAAVSLGAWVLRWGSIAHFISETILTGFKVGAGVVIASTQLPQLFGISAGGAGFFGSIRHAAVHLGETHWPSLAVGLGGLALLIVGQVAIPRWPVSLIVVALAILATSGTRLGAHGIKVVGDIPHGLPHFGLPAIGGAEVGALLPLALACFFLAYVEGISAARTFAVKHHYRVDPNQELLALGAVNLALGLGQGYPAAGGMSQSAVNDRGGAQTPLAIACASAWIGLTLMFLTDLLRNLPLPILAALVLASVRAFISAEELRNLGRVSRSEFWVALTSVVAVLVFGILQGVMLAAIFSLGLLIKRVASPSMTVLGRVPGSDHYADVVRHPECERIPGVLILRPNAELVYFNAQTVENEVLERASRPDLAVRLLVLDLSFSSFIDVPTVRVLADLHEELAARGITLRLAEVHHLVRGLLSAAGMEQRLGDLGRRASVQEAVDETSLP